MALRLFSYLWLALTCYLLLNPKVGFEQHVLFPNEDKVAHLGLFFNLFVLWKPELRKLFSLNYKHALVLAAGIGLFMSIVTELLQHYIPGRQMDWQDFIFNVLGILFGILFMLLLEKKKTNVA
jgi:VanZ family protein